MTVRRPDHVKSWAEFEFLPGVLETLRYLKRAGIRVIVLTNQSVVDQPPTVPPLPPWLRGASMREMTFTGTLDHYILNDHGDIDGLILSNGYEVKFPPHIGMPVAMALAQQPAATIRAIGYGTTNGFGTVVDAMTGSLTVGSQPVPLTGPPGPPPPPP